MTGRDIARLGCAVLLGMAVAFPLGLLIGTSGGETASGHRPEGAPAERRDPFSPRVRDDPYFREQQRRNVEALEAHCRESGEMCAEAAATRRWFEAED